MSSSEAALLYPSGTGRCAARVRADRAAGRPGVRCGDLAVGGPDRRHAAGADLPQAPGGAFDLIDRIDRTGMLPPLQEGGFTAFCHRPGELRDEITQAALKVTDLVSVEGPAFILGDLDARMADPADRSVALEVARAIERVPELAGIGPHLIATGIRSLASP
jgi:hypothetical protein